MKTIRSWNDLEPYGIDMLTGEACGYGYRLLCDLTPQGVNIIKECLGLVELKREMTLPSNWNSRGVSSIMLPREMFTSVAIFALFGANCKQVFVTYDGHVYGVEETDSDEKVADFVKWHQGEHCDTCNRYGKGGGIQFQYRNAGYSRNRHAMTGRTA